MPVSLRGYDSVLIIHSMSIEFIIILRYRTCAMVFSLRSRSEGIDKSGDRMFPGVDLLVSRERRGPSQDDVSKRAGISRSAKSVPTIKTLVQLAVSRKLPCAKFLSTVGLLRK